MFETVLAGHPTPRRRALAGPLSFGLHATVIAAIVLTSAWRITDPGEPNVPIVLVSPSAPPPPLGAPGETTRVRTPSPRPSPPEAVRPIALVPTEIPVRIGPLSGAPSSDLPVNVDTTAGGSGSPAGVDGGTGASESSGSGDGVGPISATAPDVVAPRLLRQVAPEYPEAARRLREQGIVLLQAIIGTSGEVENVRVVSSSSSRFEEAALRALEQWRYSPATLAGRAVRVYLTVTIRFTLH